MGNIMNRKANLNLCLGNVYQFKCILEILSLNYKCDLWYICIFQHHAWLTWLDHLLLIRVNIHSPLISGRLLTRTRTSRGFTTVFHWVNKNAKKKNQWFIKYNKQVFIKMLSLIQWLMPTFLFLSCNAWFPGLFQGWYSLV